MLEINSLEGYSGLRLRDNKPLQIKNGINLIVGKNGSGKSNFALLVRYILTKDGSLTGKALLESQYLKQIEKDTIDNYELRKSKLPKEQQNNDVIYGEQDFRTKVICEYKVDGVNGRVDFNYKGNARIDAFRSLISDLKINTNEFNLIPAGGAPAVTSVEIKPEIYINEETINIGTNFTLFAPSGNQNPIVRSIAEDFNNYFQNELEDFRLNNDKLKAKLKQLEASVLKDYNTFFESVDKKIEITLDPKLYNLRALVLRDKENIISFDRLSDGEKNLFNLIIKLSTSRGTKPGLLIFDEPEIFMHDDMIKTLVIELDKLATDLPDSIILISSHSSAMIEMIAELGAKKANLVVINNKQIYNSDKDLDFIAALSQNGVGFSPLYISKRPNLFIENNSKTGDKLKEFFLRFFDDKNKPNIIPIGSSGEVKQFSRFQKVLQDLLKTQIEEKTIGIMDGDIWIVKKLDKVFEGHQNIDTLLDEIEAYDCYINPMEKSNIRYLNFWEIENLYLTQELLGFWKSKQKKESLNEKSYSYFLRERKEVIIKSWLKTYERSLFKPIYFDETLKQYYSDLESTKKILIGYNDRKNAVDKGFDSLFEKLLERKMFNWFPGKEIKNQLISEYDFDDANIDFENLNLSKSIRSIIN